MMQVPRTTPKAVAAIVTEYRRHSHADVLVGKILEGFGHDGKEFPRLRVASMYVDQFPANDWSRDLAKKHGFPIYDKIEDAITLGKNDVSVDGVLIIGEHGRYPKNDRDQILYPRRRFFEEATDVMARYKKPVPVFNDKHLSYNWRDAKWMYDRARELKIPFMAGSSLPLTWRRPALQLERNTDLVEVVQVGYAPLEGYGFHALEAMQCMVERRRGGETGVRWAQCLSGPEMWDAVDKGMIDRGLYDEALRLVPAHSKLDIRKATAKHKDACIFLFEYRDGLKAAVLLPNGWVYEGDSGAFSFAGKIKGRPQLVGTHFFLQNEDPFGHFGYQVRAIDNMVHTGHPSYPVERTLLTTGMLEAVMISLAEKNRKVETPHLEIRYEANNWPFATDPVPPKIKR
jgi:hypothetical protein